MIRSKGGTVIGGAFWTPGATVVGGTSKKTFDQLIQSLFANNEQGFFYDPNDLSTMYQDVSGTNPVTVAGQPVGLILDKSGRNNHARQTNSASRPILRKNAVTGAYYLEFDGSDDFLRTNNINFTATDKVSLFAGVRKLSDVSVASVVCLTETPISSQGTFEFYTPQTNGSEGLAYYSRGATTKSTVITTGFKSPSSFVLSAKTDISSNSTTVKINSSIFPPAGTGLGGGYFGNHPLYIGRRGGISLPFNGHIYGLIGIGKLTSDSETIALEKELAKRTGVTLSV